jgi:hypothetical protein
MKRDRDFEDHPWFIIPVPPGREQSYHRWNLALISVLMFVVLGVFAMTLIPELAHATRATTAQHHRPTHAATVAR